MLLVFLVLLLLSYFLWSKDYFLFFMSKNTGIFSIIPKDFLNIKYIFGDIVVFSYF
jgi:hypothetical protein